MKAYLTRRYMFSASHRLHSDAMSDEANRETYGKCNNPHGHGHNYVLEVTVSGQVDANRHGVQFGRSGQICCIAKCWSGSIILTSTRCRNFERSANYGKSLHPYP